MRIAQMAANLGRTPNMNDLGPVPILLYVFPGIDPHAEGLLVRHPNLRFIRDGQVADPKKRPLVSAYLIERLLPQTPAQDGQNRVGVDLMLELATLASELAFYGLFRLLDRGES
jgi:hypothetical protein